MSQYRRKNSYRLKDFDYSSGGYYFITINVLNQDPCFGKIKNGIVGLSEIGSIAYQYWEDIPKHFPEVVLDEFIIMPEHMHGIIYIKPHIDRIVEECHGTPIRIEVCHEPTVEVCHEPTLKVCHGTPIRSEHGTQKPSKHGRTNDHQKPNTKGIHKLGVIINQYKSSVKRWCNKNNHSYFHWQRNFYDRIIWDEKSLYYVRRYIQRNPIRYNNSRSLPWQASMVSDVPMSSSRGVPRHAYTNDVRHAYTEKDQHATDERQTQTTTGVPSSTGVPWHTQTEEEAA